MKEQFVPYELALKLKELGFDEECLAFYVNENIYPVMQEPAKGSYFNSGVFEETLRAPLWQQAFDWFRKKHKLFVKIDFFQSDEFKGVDYDYCIVNLDKPFKKDGITDNIIIDYSVNETYYFKYEEARQACLEKLIELCEKN